MAADEGVLAALRALDTPSVCNAIEILAPERRGWGYTTRPLLCCTPQLGAMVGYAVTGTLRAMHPSGLDEAGQRERRLAWYRYVEASPPPSVVVIQDLDSQPGYGSFWGEVNTAVHQGLGAVGVVTDGSVRDLDACAEGFHMLAGLVAPSHAWARIEEFGIAVTVAGMTVRPGDLVHADRHGAVVVPHAIAHEIPATAAAVARGEAVIIEAARRPGFTVDDLEDAMRRRDGLRHRKPR